MKAVILLSGGLDSSTVLYQARADGYQCYAISFDYHQRHRRELQSAMSVAQSLGVVEHQLITFDLRSWGGSALTDNSIPVPQNRPLDQMSESIPITYVPARNSIFLSFALAYAETIGAERVYIGVNALDYIHAMQEVFRLGTKQGREGKEIDIVAPLINLTKTQIIRLGNRLGVPWELTWSCYIGEQHPCGVCDSCQLRWAAFHELGLEDPVRQQGM